MSPHVIALLFSWVLRHSHLNYSPLFVSVQQQILLLFRKKGITLNGIALSWRLEPLKAAAQERRETQRKLKRL